VAVGSNCSAGLANSIMRLAKSLSDMAVIATSV
jgi:hypothetical protein